METGLRRVLMSPFQTDALGKYSRIILLFLSGGFHRRQLIILYVKQNVNSIATVVSAVDTSMSS